MVLISNTFFFLFSLPLVKLDEYESGIDREDEATEIVDGAYDILLFLLDMDFSSVYLEQAWSCNNKKALMLLKGEVAKFSANVATVQNQEKQEKRNSVDFWRENSDKIWLLYTTHYKSDITSWERFTLDEKGGRKIQWKFSVWTIINNKR